MAIDQSASPTNIATADDITPVWMTHALSAFQPGVEVLSLVRGETIIGAQSKIRVRVRLNHVGRTAGIPEKLIVKADIEEFGLGPVATVTFNEPRSYRDVVPFINVEAPAVYAADPGGNGPSYLIMEDLDARGVRFLDLAEPINQPLAKKFIDRIARIHARWWDSPALEDSGAFGQMRQPFTGMFEDFIHMKLSPAYFPGFAALPRAAATPRILCDPARLRNGLFRLRDFHKTVPRCVVHGDTHLNNLYVTADGEPGFYDWSPRRTVWAQDLAYFIPAALDTPNRRQWEASLLRHYLEALPHYGVKAPSLNDAWLAYRRELIWGMFVFLTNGPTQTEYNNTAAAARFAAAMLDHNTLDLLGV